MNLFVVSSRTSFLGLVSEQVIVQLVYIPNQWTKLNMSCSFSHSLIVRCSGSLEAFQSTSCIFNLGYVICIHEKSLSTNPFCM